MIPLHVHSNHSLLEGAASIRQLVGRAVEYGLPALALTDTAGLYGAVPFYEAARAAHVKPILGTQLGPAVLLARDREGYAQLCEILTAYHLGTLTLDELGGWPFDFGTEHLFVLSHHVPLLRALARQGLEPLVAMTHHGGPRGRQWAGQAYDCARRLGLKPVAVNPAYFLDPGDHLVHRTLAAIRHNTTVDNLRTDEVAGPEAYLLPPAEYARRYADWPDARNHAAWVAEQCNVELELGRPQFPPFEVPAGETHFSWLWKKTFEGVHTRYQPLTPKIMDRVRYELDIIERLGFAAYFLIVWDIVAFARARGIPIVGRGSAANSVVAYALGITRADPFKYDLYFERFLNMARTDCPDIDLDICWRRRDEVINYVYEKYGGEQVAMIATFNTFKARAALREVAKAHGLMDHEITPVARRIPHYGARDIRRLVAQAPECKGLSFEAEPWRSILAAAERIDGYPRHLSIHAGGLVIAPRALTRYVPLQRATKGLVISQYDMGPIERLGLVKMDLLGHRSLTVLADTVESVRRNRGIELDLESLPDPDPLTGRLIRTGQTIGCFQIESPAMRGLLPKVQADNTDLVIKALSLVRPGPSGSGMKEKFIACRRGLEPPAFIHPAFEEILGDTYGIMLYQEDILKVASALAGMTLAEADALRRAMGKQRSPQAMAQNMKRFMDGARANGVAGPVAQEIWERIANFAAYSYCKAHAAGYGELAYQCCYCKAHFTAEFLAAVLTNRGGFYAPHVYLEEAKRCGVRILPPCVNHSDWAYTAEDDAIRVGLLEVRDLNSASIEAILEAREEGGRFSGLAELRERAGVPHSDAEALFHAGALDGFELPRPQLLWQLRLLYQSERTRQRTETAARSLFAYEAPAPGPALPDYSRKRRLDAEWRALGLFTGADAHPLMYYQGALQEGGPPRVLSADIPHYIDHTVVAAGWLIAQRQHAVKDGRGVMKFITLEDPAGTFEVVFFPEVYQQFGHLLTGCGPFVVTGKVNAEHDAPALIADSVQVVQPNLAEAAGA